MKLIDKDILVAEMKRRISNLEQLGDRKYIETHFIEQFRFIEVYEGIIDFINSLEMKEEFKIGETQIYLEDDGGEPPYDGKQWLDLSCTEYEIPEDIFKDGDDVEIIIRKKKGENYGYSH